MSGAAPGPAAGPSWSQDLLRAAALTLALPVVWPLAWVAGYVMSFFGFGRGHGPSRMPQGELARHSYFDDLLLTGAGFAAGLVAVLLTMSLFRGQPPSTRAALLHNGLAAALVAALAWEGWHPFGIRLDPMRGFLFWAAVVLGGWGVIWTFRESEATGA